MRSHLARACYRAAQKSVSRLLLIGLAISLPANWCYAIHFNEISRFNLQATSGGANYIGNFPMAVAWNGSKLYASGFKTTGTNLISIIEIQNATATGEVASPAFSSVFGTVNTTPTHRGYIALELKGNILAAANDQGGNSVNGIQLFDTTNNTLLWNLSASSQSLRGGSGVAFDPGWNGNPAEGSGVAFTVLASDRRALLNEADGALIYGLDDGLIWRPDDVGSNARDMTFDPSTGDIYVRHSNGVLRADRTGANSTNLETRRAIVPLDAANSSTLNGQHLEFMDTTVGGDLLIYNYNDPASATIPEAFSSAIKVIGTEGEPQAVNFNRLGGGAFPDGDGRYDFDFDPVTQTLALLDFSNRSISIFELSATGPTDETGDFDDDGDVDGADFLAWQRGLGTESGATLEQGDGNGDGAVDADDLALWRTSFAAGVSGASTGAAAAVPEPASAALCVLGVSALMLGRRTQRQC